MKLSLQLSMAPEIDTIVSNDEQAVEKSDLMII